MFCLFDDGSNDHCCERQSRVGVHHTENGEKMGCNGDEKAENEANQRFLFEKRNILKKKKVE